MNVIDPVALLDTKPGLDRCHELIAAGRGVDHELLPLGDSRLYRKAVQLEAVAVGRADEIFSKMDCRRNAGKRCASTTHEKVDVAVPQAVWRQCCVHN